MIDPAVEDGPTIVTARDDLIASQSGTNYQRTILDNGIRVVTETMPHIRSLAIGIWFDTGSRDEPHELAGISHFLEHMNFKGTARRSPASIVREIEGRGGHLNAFTSKEVTCFYARVVDKQLSRVVDVLSDITQNSLYIDEDVVRERRVILEELKNVEDTPDEWVFEHFISHVFDTHSMGRPVLGMRDTLDIITQNKLIDYRSERYDGSRTVVSAAGHLDHRRLVKMIERRFNSNSQHDQERTPPPKPESGNHRQDIFTATQQAHICWGCRSYSYHDNRKYPLLVLNTILGGGMSSRLFQQIREKAGLAYSVYSIIDTYFDTGIFCIYAGVEPERTEEALQKIKSEVRKLVRQPVSKRELQRTKDQLKGNLLLGLESPSSHMQRLARMEIFMGEWQSLDAIVERIDAVTADDLQSIATDLFVDQASFTTVLLPE